MSDFIAFTRANNGKEIAIPKDRITRVERVNDDPVITYLPDNTSQTSEVGVKDDWKKIMHLLKG